MKKYLLFFAAFALLLVGCAQNEIVENRSEKNVIGFSTLNDKVTKSANDDKDDYGVFAVWSENNTAWFMKDQLVENNNSYAPVQYWPHEGNVDFFAYAPHSSLTKIDDTENYRLTISDATVGTPIVTYTVKEDAHEDFTVATPVLDRNANTVDLQFNHMLSKLTVGSVLTEALTGAGFTLDFSKASVDLKVAQNKRTIDLSTTETPAWNTSFATESGQATYSHSFAKTVGENTTISNPSFMVMPQTTFASETSKVSLQLKNVIIKKDGVIYWGGETGADLAVYEFKGTEIANLEPNKHYAITFTIANGAADGDNEPVFGNAIEFTSDITPWDTANNGVDINQPNN